MSSYDNLSVLTYMKVQPEFERAAVHNIPPLVQPYPLACQLCIPDRFFPGVSNNINQKLKVTAYYEFLLFPGSIINLISPEGQCSRAYFYDSFRTLSC